MNNMNWLLRASKWARHPPSARMVKMVLGIVAIAIGIFVLEKMGWWPDWARVENARRPPLPH